MTLDAAAKPWSPDDTRVLQILANVLTSQRHEDRAVVLLEYAREQAPDDIEVKQALSGVYLLLGRDAEALEMADQTIASVTDDAVLTGITLVRAKALWNLGRESDARAAMQDYIQLRQRP